MGNRLNYWGSFHSCRWWTAEIHVGTGSVGSSSELPWGEQKTSKVIGNVALMGLICEKISLKTFLGIKLGVIFRYSNNRMRFFFYLCVQNLTIQK